MLWVNSLALIDKTLFLWWTSNRATKTGMSASVSSDGGYANIKPVNEAESFYLFI